MIIIPVITGRQKICCDAWKFRSFESLFMSTKPFRRFLKMFIELTYKANDLNRTF